MSAWPNRARRPQLDRSTTVAPSITSSRFIAATASAVAAALLLAGCSAPAETNDGISIVASTNVYGDIAAAIAGDLATVTSIIDSTAQDPHSYEATVQDQLALSKAEIAIENGGGYDPFVRTMLAAVDSNGVVVISASEVSGLSEGDEGHRADDHSADDHSADTHIEGFNEHVWYSFAAMDRLAHEIAQKLRAIDRPNANTYAQNYETFSAELRGLSAVADELRAVHGGQSVAVTERVPQYLFDDIGLQNLTPPRFSDAVENSIDVAPAVLLEALAVIERGDIKLMAYNEQTAGAETRRLLDAALEAGIPVVSFTETLPEGASYIDWMRSNLNEIRLALE